MIVKKEIMSPQKALTAAVDNFLILLFLYSWLNKIRIGRIIRIIIRKKCKFEDI